MEANSEERLLKLALKEDKIVSIYNVQNGKACECICPECRSPLIARNRGKIRAPHFAHFDESKCKGAIETALHFLAKEILNETKKIYIPHYTHYYPFFDRKEILINHNKCLEFDAVKLEEIIPVGDTFIKADAICEKQGKKIIIEFAKSHFVDEDKRRKLIELGISCIEFSISSGSQEKKEFTKQLHSNFFDSYWIVNRKGEKKIAGVEAILVSEYQKAREKEMLLRQKEIKERNERQEMRRRQMEEKFRRDASLKEKKLADARKKGNLIQVCPIKNELFRLRCAYAFGDYEIFERICDAKNISPIYDRMPDFIDIFIDGEREFLIPPGYYKMDSKDQYKWRDYYLSIQKYMDCKDTFKFNPCNHCRLFKGTIYEFIICAFEVGVSPKECFRR